MILISRAISLLLLLVALFLKEQPDSGYTVPTLSAAPEEHQQVLDAADAWMEYASLERAHSVRVAAPEVMPSHRPFLARESKTGGSLLGLRVAGSWSAAIRSAYCLSFFADPSPARCRLRLCLLRI